MHLNPAAKLVHFAPSPQYSNRGIFITPTPKTRDTYPLY